MKVLFFLDVKLVEYNNEYYTTGAADYEYFNKFRINNNNKIIVFCRKTVAKSIKNNMAKATGKNIEIRAINSYFDLLKTNNKKIITDLILNSDIHMVKQPTLIGSYACHIMRKHKIKYFVNMVGCPWDALWNRNIIGKFIAPIMYFIVKHYVKYADAVMYVTNKFLQKRYPTNGKSLGCSDVIIKSQDENVLSERLNKLSNFDASKKLIIGTIGSVDVKYKGQQHVIKAMKYLQRCNYNIEYQLVGNGSQNKLMKLAQKYGINKNIKFIGIIPHDKIFDWFDDIDIYIQPSDVEGLCRSVIEAMSRACPTIVSNVGGNPELINSKYCFKKGNIKQLSNVIKCMTKEEMISAATENFNNSKNFNSSLLNEKKEKFLIDFVKHNIL